MARSSAAVRQLKDEASRLLAQGKVKRACELYVELARLSPDDPVVRLRHGDACRRLGQVRQSVKSYTLAAELFHRAGNYACARAAQNLVLELTGEKTKPQRRDDEAPTVLGTALPAEIDEDPTQPNAYLNIPRARTPRAVAADTDFPPNLLPKVARPLTERPALRRTRTGEKAKERPERSNPGRKRVEQRALEESFTDFEILEDDLLDENAVTNPFAATVPPPGTEARRRSTAG